MVTFDEDMVGDADILGPSTALRIWNADADQGDAGICLVLGPTKAQRIQAHIGVPVSRRGKRHIELIYGQLAVLKGDLLIELPEEELLKLESDLCVPVTGELCQITGEVSREWVQSLIKEAVGVGVSPQIYLQLLKEIRKGKEKKTNE